MSRRWVCNVKRGKSLSRDSKALPTTPLHQCTNAPLHQCTTVQYHYANTLNYPLFVIVSCTCVFLCVAGTHPSHPVCGHPAPRLHPEGPAAQHSLQSHQTTGQGAEVSPGKITSTFSQFYVWFPFYDTIFCYLYKFYMYTLYISKCGETTLRL